jgi:hypothetical protein
MTLSLLINITNRVFIRLTKTWKIEQTNDLLNYGNCRVAGTTMPSMKGCLLTPKACLASDARRG